MDGDGVQDPLASDGSSSRTEESPSPDLASLVESPLIAGSSTKLEILQVLSKRRMTAPEVARDLDMDRTGVYRHLEALTEAGHVQRDESERKWVYYSLTKKGKTLSVLGSNGALIAIIVACLGLLGYLVLEWWTRWQTWKEESGMYDTPEPIPAPDFPIVSTIAVVLVALLLVGANRWLHGSAN